MVVTAVCQRMGWLQYRQLFAQIFQVEDLCNVICTVLSIFIFSDDKFCVSSHLSAVDKGFRVYFVIHVLLVPHRDRVFSVASLFCSCKIGRICFLYSFSFHCFRSHSIPSSKQLCSLASSPSWGLRFFKKIIAVERSCHTTKKCRERWRSWGESIRLSVKSFLISMDLYRLTWQRNNKCMTSPILWGSR